MKKRKHLDENDDCASARLVRMVKCVKKSICDRFGLQLITWPLDICCVVQVLRINPEKKNIDSFSMEDFELKGYRPHKKIAMTMAV